MVGEDLYNTRCARARARSSHLRLTSTPRARVVVCSSAARGRRRRSRRGLSPNPRVHVRRPPSSARCTPPPLRPFARTHTTHYTLYTTHTGIMKHAPSQPSNLAKPSSNLSASVSVCWCVRHSLKQLEQLFAFCYYTSTTTTTTAATTTPTIVRTRPRSEVSTKCRAIVCARARVALHSSSSSVVAVVAVDACPHTCVCTSSHARAQSRGLVYFICVCLRAHFALAHAAQLNGARALWSISSSTVVE